MNAYTYTVLRFKRKQTACTMYQCTYVAIYASQYPVLKKQNWFIEFSLSNFQSTYYLKFYITIILD